jgi:hypothetical protein
VRVLRRPAKATGREAVSDKEPWDAWNEMSDAARMLDWFNLRSRLAATSKELDEQRKLRDIGRQQLDEQHARQLEANETLIKRLAAVTDERETTVADLRSRLADVETRMQAQTVLAVSYLNVITEQAGRLAAADALLREGCGYIDDVPDARSAYKDRVRAHLAAAREGEK